MSKSEGDEQTSGQGRSADLSLTPLDPEKALWGFMEVDPEKVKKRINEEGESDSDE